MRKVKRVENRRVPTERTLRFFRWPVCSGRNLPALFRGGFLDEADEFLHIIGGRVFFMEANADVIASCAFSEARVDDDSFDPERARGCERAERDLGAWLHWGGRLDTASAEEWAIAPDLHRNSRTKQKVVKKWAPRRREGSLWKQNVLFGRGVLRWIFAGYESRQKSPRILAVLGQFYDIWERGSVPVNPPELPHSSQRKA